MTDIQAADNALASVAVDPFEDGWDCGVDWANVRATDVDLLAVQQLNSRRCFDIKALLETLNCEADDLFILTRTVTVRHVEGFLAGAAAVYSKGAV
jgi:hypothetical protein